METHSTKFYYMKKIYFVADSECGNYTNEVEFFSSKKKLDAYIKAEMANGKEIVSYSDFISSDESLRYYWDWEYVN